MSNQILLPKLGNSVESCIIVSWLKQVGDVVAEGEPICTVETDKTTMEVLSTASGSLLKHLVNVGDDVPVMSAIATVGGAAAISVSPRARKLAEANNIAISTLIGTGPGGRVIERDVQAALAAPSQTAAPSQPAAPRITPLAQRIAQERSINISQVTGTGPNGQIKREDVEREANSVESPIPTPPSPHPLITSSPPPALTPTRKRIAERMRASLHNAAQLTMTTSADARALQSYRRQLKTSDPALELQEVTINDLVLFAVSRTLPQFPDLNATFADGALTQSASVHLGFAVDTPRGLLVPVIQQAETLPLRQLAMRARTLATQARAGKLTPDQMSGGSFTVSNLGQFGIESFTPILNPPQVAILGVGGIDLKPVLVNETVEHIPHLHLSLTIDHQVVDGAPAARFLQTLCRNLAQFDLLLAL